MITILTGDCREVLKGLADGSVQCAVTSPPYFGLRSYLPDGHPDKALEMGAEKTPDAYVAEMVAVFREVRRVLRDDGTCWINIGDSYASGGGVSHPHRDGSSGGIGRKGTRGTQGYADAGGGVFRPDTISGSTKHKDLIGIPWLLAFALRADGWYLRSEIIWAKKNPMPESVTDRPTKAHEQVFLLSKRSSYFYDAAAVAEPSETFGRQNTSGPSSKILDARADGLGYAKTDPYSYETRNRRSVWTIATQPYSGAHFATMPPELAETCIKAGTSERGQCPACGAPWARVEAPGYQSDDRPQMRRARELFAKHGLRDEHLTAIRAVGITDAGKAQTTQDGFGKNTPEMQALADEAKAALGGYYREFLISRPTTTGWASTCRCPAHDPVPQTVLDPFGGAGTTGLVADRLGRHATLIELNPAYAADLRARIKGDAGLFYTEAAE